MLKDMPPSRRGAKAGGPRPKISTLSCCGLPEDPEPARRVLSAPLHCAPLTDEAPAGPYTGLGLSRAIGLVGGMAVMNPSITRRPDLILSLESLGRLAGKRDADPAVRGRWGASEARVTWVG